MRVALKFAYDGQKFYGYARQPNLRTVEGDIIEILIKNKLIADPKISQLRSASRTDKRVSSLGNVTAFNTNFFDKNTLNQLNYKDNEILFYGYKKVDEDFYPRYAKLRHYRYYLYNGNLDNEKIIDTLSIFIGEHDFSNFARVEPDKNPVRTIDNIIVEEFENFLIIDFFAPNFLRNQIRRIISAVQKVGLGKISNKDIMDALNYPENKVDFGLSSAGPLILKDVIYDFDFELDPTQVGKVEKLENSLVSSIKNH